MYPIDLEGMSCAGRQDAACALASTDSEHSRVWFQRCSRWVLILPGCAHVVPDLHAGNNDNISWQEGALKTE
jgi:hypothetical protein